MSHSNISTSTEWAEDIAGLAGDLSLFTLALGSPLANDDQALAGGFMRSHRVNSLPALRTFLDDYQQRILAPLEFPAIAEASGRARRGEVRELIELDQRIAHEPLLKEFAVASAALGRSHLRKLQPMRGNRFVQRYIDAVKSGEAHGWHQLVYGVILGVYSLPLRQGMIRYGCLTVEGLVRATSATLKLSEQTRNAVIEEFHSCQPVLVEANLKASGHSQLQIL